MVKLKFWIPMLKHTALWNVEVVPDGGESIIPAIMNNITTKEADIVFLQAFF